MNGTNYFTMRDIADELDERMHIIRYNIDEHKILHTAVIGKSRVWSREQLDEIRAAIQRTRTRAPNRAAVA